MTQDLSSTRDRIRAAVQNQDEATLQTIVGDVATFYFKKPAEEGETFSEEVFGFIIDLLEQNILLRMKGSYHLLMLFEYDWSTLNEDQRLRLLQALRKSYDKFRDWMSQFVITELLGEYYCDDAAFEVLTELESISDEVGRSLVPHGYEHLIKGATQQALREQALKRLLLMKNDPSAKVRTEVEEALGKSM